MGEIILPSDQEKESWTIDQITKSEFFHQKLHEWSLLEIAYERERVKGEDFEWNRKDLVVFHLRLKFASSRYNFNS